MSYDTPKQQLYVAYASLKTSKYFSQVCTQWLCCLLDDMAMYLKYTI